MDTVSQNLSLARKYESENPLLAEAYLNAAARGLFADGYEQTVVDSVYRANYLQIRAAARRGHIG
jgi:hypothetical protein